MMLPRPYAGSQKFKLTEFLDLFKPRRGSRNGSPALHIFLSPKFSLRVFLVAAFDLVEAEIEDLGESCVVIHTDGTHLDLRRRVIRQG